MFYYLHKICVLPIFIRKTTYADTLPHDHSKSHHSIEPKGLDLSSSFANFRQSQTPAKPAISYIPKSQNFMQKPEISHKRIEPKQTEKEERRKKKRQISSRPSARNGERRYRLRSPEIIKEKVSEARKSRGGRKKR